MRNLLLISLLTFSLTAHAATPVQNSFAVPWRPIKRELYKEPNLLELKKAAGLSLSEFFSLEGSMYNLDYYQNLLITQSGFDPENAQSYNLLGVGKIPLSDRLTFFGKLGPSYYQPTHEINSPLFTPTETDQIWGVSYATGANFKLSSHLQLSLEYIRTENKQVDVESGIAQMSWSF